VIRSSRLAFALAKALVTFCLGLYFAFALHTTDNRLFNADAQLSEQKKVFQLVDVMKTFLERPTFAIEP
jgi:hypothetical protein